MRPPLFEVSPPTGHQTALQNDLINCPVAGLTVAIAISVPPPKSFGAILIFNLMESEVCEGEKEKTIIEGRWGGTRGGVFGKIGNFWRAVTSNLLERNA